MEGSKIRESKGIIPLFGVYLSLVSVSYYNRLSFDFEIKMGKAREAEAQALLIEAAQECGYATCQGIRTSWEMSYSKNHRVKWGAEVIRHNYIPSIRSEQRTFQSVELDSMRKADPVSVTEWTQYAEWSFTISDNFRMFSFPDSTSTVFIF